MDTRSKVLGMVTEGPIAFDGTTYMYSRGERLYIDGLAKHFKEIVLITQVFRPDNLYYSTACHSPFSAPNLTILELPGGQMGASPVAKVLQMMRTIVVVAGMVRRLDVLYLFLPSYPSAMAWLCARLFRVPHIVYAADDWEQATPGMFKWEHLRDSWFYRLYAWVNRRFEAAIVGSAMFGVTAGGALKEKYLRLGCPAYLTSPRITLSLDHVVERDDTCGGPEIRLLNVGTLNFDKAQHDLLAAFGSVAAARPQLRLTIVGHGEREQALKQQVADAQLVDKVDFTGFINDEDVLYGVFQACDVFVLSSVSEGFPRVLYEAAALGLPIVTTDCGGITRFLENERSALIVPTNNPAALAAAIERVLTDGDLRRRMIAEARRDVTEMLANKDGGQVAKLMAVHAAV